MTEQAPGQAPPEASPFPYADIPHLNGYTQEELQYPPRLTDAEAAAVVDTLGGMKAAEVAQDGEGTYHEVISGITHDRNFVSAVVRGSTAERAPEPDVTVYGAPVSDLADGGQPQPLYPPRRAEEIRDRGGVSYNVRLSEDDMLRLPVEESGGMPTIGPPIRLSVEGDELRSPILLFPIGEDGQPSLSEGKRPLPIVRKPESERRQAIAVAGAEDARRWYEQRRTEEDKRIAALPPRPIEPTVATGGLRRLFRRAR